MPDGEFRNAMGLLKQAPNVWDMTLPWVDIYWSIDILRRYYESGYSYVNLTIQDFPATYEGVIRDIKRFKELCEPHSDWLCFAATTDEVNTARSSGKLALGINVQDTVLVHDDLSRLQVLLDLGVRHMLLAYQLRNRAADGCAEEADGGLSIFGQNLVKEMNRVGMVVDLSHVGRQSTLEATELSSRPVIYSHSGILGLNKHIRNIDDEQIKTCASTGGVIGIVGIGSFVGDPAMTSETFFKNVDYVAQLVGPEHVGIGTDFIDDLEPIYEAMKQDMDASWRDPYGTQLYEGVAFRPEQLSELVELMIKAGYPDTAINGVLGGNFYRIYKDEEEHRNRAKQ